MSPGLHSCRMRTSEVPSACAGHHPGDLRTLPGEGGGLLGVGCWGLLLHRTPSGCESETSMVSGNPSLSCHSEEGVGDREMELSLPRIPLWLCIRDPLALKEPSLSCGQGCSCPLPCKARPSWNFLETKPWWLPRC